ncbi:nucleotide exchange factor GrpE [Halobellus ruber]|uniref:Protein GrpE n=1 Tax=Halobellus ruber TaxID=2761102 RepID=A0A7J9SPH1_9EURY|nr:nucleotide exchange factor GrpE [Halobellus ruber]MBB6647351.1 nucleotide exchange factor GrpE [Halobellus ruber]
MFGSDDDEEPSRSTDEDADGTDAGANDHANPADDPDERSPAGGEGSRAGDDDASRDGAHDEGPATEGEPAEPADGPDDRDRRAAVDERLREVETRLTERIGDVETAIAANRERIDELESGLADHRRRSEKEREEIREFAVEEFAREMVRVKDSLETAIQVEDLDDSAAERLELLTREFEQALSKGNVEPIDDSTEEFDALRHKIVSKEPSPDHESNEILEIAEPGYAIGDRVLRPARVVLSA